MREDSVVELEVGEEFLRNVREKERRMGIADEVVMVVPRPGGKVLLHTKSFYPPGTYRLPTGRLRLGESPEAANRDNKLLSNLHKPSWLFCEFRQLVVGRTEPFGSLF